MLRWTETEPDRWECETHRVVGLNDVNSKLMLREKTWHAWRKNGAGQPATFIGMYFTLEGAQFQCALDLRQRGFVA